MKLMLNREVFEYRGIPTTGEDKFVYGDLSIISEKSSGVFLAIESNNTLRINKIFKIGDIEVIPNSVGQLISRNPRLYEGDILTHSDYKNCLFEFQWSEASHGWVPRLIYGSLGNIYLRSFPKYIEDYEIVGTNNKFNWYPKALPRYLNKCNYGIFMGYNDDVDVYYESIMGDSGEVYGIKGNDKIVYRSRDEVPWLKGELKNRKLIRE